MCLPLQQYCAASHSWHCLSESTSVWVCVYVCVGQVGSFQGEVLMIISLFLYLSTNLRCILTLRPTYIVLLPFILYWWSLIASLSFKSEGVTLTTLVIVNPSDIDVVRQYLSPPTLPSCVSPRVRTCREKTRLSHIDWGSLTPAEKNKDFSSLLRGLGKDLLKVVLRRFSLWYHSLEEMAR